MNFAGVSRRLTIQLAIKAVPKRSVDGCQIAKMSTSQFNPVETAIRNKLTHKFEPTYLEVINESYMHNVPKGAETHFKVVVVSNQFENTPLIQRHRKINEALDGELKSGLHALSIVARTPDQWTDEKVAPSPKCLGGFGK